MKPRCFIGFFALLGFLLAACAQQIANPVPIKSYPTQATETTAELTLKPTALPKAEQAQVNPLNAESESTESAVQNDQPAIIWNAKAATCEVAEISTAEVSFGSCEGAQRSEPILEETGRPEELAYFLQTYAPFQAETDAGDIVFHGEGGQQATPIEERMIAEWARQAFLEASAGRRDASWGLVLSWRQEGGVVGLCGDLSLYTTGVAYASSCKDPSPIGLGRTRLTSKELEQVYGWIDRFESFDVEQEIAGADAVMVHMVFSGSGKQQAEVLQKEEILDFAAHLFSRISAGENLSSDEPEVRARQVLLGYFQALNQGNYAQAVAYYGGDYEVLTDNNPTIPSEEHPALFQAACRMNGFQCFLPINRIVDVQQTAPGEYQFLVEFKDPNGGVFEQGPCCGADPDSQPPVSLFSFAVKEEKGKFLVQDLPVYVP